MSMQLTQAVEAQYIKLDKPTCVAASTPIVQLSGEIDTLPLLVVSADGEELIGIVTAFDLL